MGPRVNVLMADYSPRQGPSTTLRTYAGEQNPFIRNSLIRWYSIKGSCFM